MAWLRSSSAAAVRLRLVLGSGCGSRSLVRLGGGDLRSLVVLLVLGVFALMTLAAAPRWARRDRRPRRGDAADRPRPAVDRRPAPAAWRRPVLADGSAAPSRSCSSPGCSARRRRADLDVWPAASASASSSSACGGRRAGSLPAGASETPSRRSSRQLAAHGIAQHGRDGRLCDRMARVFSDTPGSHARHRRRRRHVAGSAAVAVASRSSGGKASPARATSRTTWPAAR